MATLTANALSLGIEYVDVNIGGIELHPGGYAHKVITGIPSGFEPYGWRWVSNWDEHITLALTIDSNDGPCITISGTGGYAIPSSNRMVRVYFRKFTSPT